MPSLTTLLALVALATLTAVASPTGVHGTAYELPVWPTPFSGTNGTDTAYLSDSFALTCAAGVTCTPLLQRALARYMSMVFFAGAATAPPAGSKIITGLTVSCTMCDAPLELGMSESYTLDVSTTEATITATSQWGVLRGLESFAQLPEWQGPNTGSGNAYIVSQLPIAIDDKPRFQWRGALIDSARHYLTVEAVLRVIDALSYNKYNTLHWHLIDDESWPLQSTRYPKFTEAGAYAPEAIYTHDDVKLIVSHAEDRGIRVVPEFDMPAHATIWGYAYPNLTISCPEAQTLLDPTGDIYTVIENLFEEFIPLFKEDFIHIGGDEVHSMECWAQSPKVQAFMKQHGFDNTTQVRNYFEYRAQNITTDLHKSNVVWEEVFDGGYTLRNTTVVNVWLSNEETATAARAGHRVVHSFGWYLDQQDPPGGEHYFWEDTWINFFLNDPLLNTTLTPAQQELVLGGEASQWGEQVDATNIDSRMWPRACGTAFRLWSPKELRDETTAFPKLSKQRCHMVHNGIGAGPIRPSRSYGYCRIPQTSRFHAYPPM